MHWGEFVAFDESRIAVDSVVVMFHPPMAIGLRGTTIEAPNLRLF
jgi:hypothetical protein